MTSSIHNEVIIFSQAAGDTIHILDLYEKNRKNTKFSIYVIKNKNIYDYFNELDLRLKNLVFIPYPKRFGLYNIQLLRKEKKRINSLFKKHFINSVNHKIYFFAHVYDYLTMSFVLSLSKNNTVIFVDYDKYDTNKTLPKQFYHVKDKMLLTIYKYLVGKQLVLTEKKAIKLLFENTNIKSNKTDEVSSKIKEKYSHNIANQSTGNSVLIFETPTAEASIINYKNTMIEILNILVKAGYKIYIKPHPYKGFSPFLRNYNVSICNANVPGELINTSGFNFIFGINSLSICRLAIDRYGSIYSLIQLFTFRRLNEKDYNIKYLLGQSNEKILFINSLNHLDKILAKR
ncbi:MAG: hypothetical protein HQ541_11750 [Mariniphaga sp.]|nr:hypothetical protein [Mariniphaga sp.]